MDTPAPTRPTADDPSRDVAPRLRHTALRAVELAEAAVLADVTVALCLLGWLLPVGAVLIAFGVVPMATIAARHRLRALVAGGGAACVTSLLVAGTGVCINCAGCAALGAVIGLALRRGWSQRRTVLATTAILGAPGAAGAVAVLAVLTGLRRLALVQVTHTWRGTSGILHRFGLTPGWGNGTVAWLVREWPVTIAVGTIIAVAGATWIAYGLAVPTFRRLDVAVPVPGPASATGTGPAAPVPVKLDRVSFRYPGAGTDALADVTMQIDVGEMVAIVGPNGSGKSTLGRVLAGAPVSAGTVVRAGHPGLGQAQGTALLFQRPETQVLGVTAADDVLWGRVSGHVDVDHVLARVGLGGFAAVETATLSGGELQRLALAAALARDPQLLVADEVTAMVDPAGRAELVRLLRSVAGGTTTVAFITHRGEELADADRVLGFARGRIAAPAACTAGVIHDVRRSATGAPLIKLEDVGHVYARRTPWAHRALTAIDLELAAGEGVLVAGRNGSGKSTLAWVLAGLLVPSEGEATMRSVPIASRLADVALAFQHPRLQLLRSTVRADVRAASGADAAAADDALRRVGLDPQRFGDRHVDHLSGGEQRRAALAGLIAGQPRVLILDEPFAGLDSAGVDELTALLAGLREETGTTLVIVSHDTETLGSLVEREIRLEAGRVVHDERQTGPNAPPAAGLPAVADRSGAPADAPVGGQPQRSWRRRRPPQAPADFTLLRPVPGSSVVHRWWAGTKLVCLLAIGAALSLHPTWAAVGVLGPLVLAGILLARIPRGAIPRLPRWFWIGVGISLLLTASAGGAPHVRLAGAAIGFGALADWARVTALAVVVLSAAALISWTTPVAAVAPALQVLARPLRWIGLPVDEWAICVGLSFRCLPLLIDEVRTLGAVRRLRAARQPRSHHRPAGRRFVDAQEFLSAAITVALRRGDELAEAIDARGGLGAFSADASRPGASDVIALLVVAAAVTAVIAVVP